MRELPLCIPRKDNGSATVQPKDTDMAVPTGYLGSIGVGAPPAYTRTGIWGDSQGTKVMGTLRTQTWEHSVWSKGTGIGGPPGPQEQIREHP